MQIFHREKQQIYGQKTLFYVIINKKTTEKLCIHILEKRKSVQI